MISTFKHPSDNSSVAFFIAAGTESRRSVMIPDVSSAVMKQPGDGAAKAAGEPAGAGDLTKNCYIAR
jgi:hypothetical protein